ncbi:MAG: hypothetical protein ACRDMJ_05260, partial [Solirubrobacteraceae bacterium]
PGIGAKTATALLAEHRSLEGAIAAAAAAGGGMRPRVAAALCDHADQLRAFREIATLQPAEVTLPADADTDLAAGAAAAERLGMRRLAERLRGARSVDDL